MATRPLEFNMFLGQKQRIPIRLIVYRLPSDVYKKAAEGGDQGRQTERPSYKSFLFKVSQVHVFHHQRSGYPVAQGSRRHNLPPPMASGADLQKLEIAVRDQCAERHPSRTHPLPYLWPPDCHLSDTTLVGAGFRPSNCRAAGAVLVQGDSMAHAQGATFESLP